MTGFERDQLEESYSHGLLADGTRLLFYKIIRLIICLRVVRMGEIFVVSRPSEDAILGIPFFVADKLSTLSNRWYEWMAGS